MGFPAPTAFGPGYTCVRAPGSYLAGSKFLRLTLQSLALGLGAWLLASCEARARARGLPVARTWCLAPDDSARRLFEQLGFREVRRFYRMLIELDGPRERTVEVTALASLSS